MFKSLDFDNDGYITAADLIELKDSRGLSLDDFDCRALMTKLDKARTGSVNISEFMETLCDKGRSFLDQLQRTIVGVSREGGTVYKNHYESTGRSTTDRSFRDISDVICSGVDKFRPPVGAVDHFYHNLLIPHRNVPWYEDNRHTVEPASWIPLNAQSVTQYPFDEDRMRRLAHREFRNTICRQHSAGVDSRARVLEEKIRETDMNRVCFKSAQIADYHQRLQRPICHVH